MHLQFFGFSAKRFGLLSATVWLPAFLLLFPVDRVLADEPATASPTAWLHEATNHLGRWIWDTNTVDKQTVRLWKNFEIPSGKITNAVLRITVDNGYTLFLDGQELGRGSDWRTVTEYDLTQILKPGRHMVAVEGFNDRLEGGLIFGLFVEFSNAWPVEVDSDESWLVVPPEIKNWTERKLAAAELHRVLVIGVAHHHPWEKWPIGLATVPPLKPVVVHFWQNGWFQLGLSGTCAGTVMVCLWLWLQLSAQSRAKKFLQVERGRIARDIHDDLGGATHPVAASGRGGATRAAGKFAGTQSVQRDLRGRTRVGAGIG